MVSAVRWLLVLGLLLIWDPAAAGQNTYQLRVEGMVCAYCAYNASKHLGQIQGVAPASVRVDLSGGTVRLSSERELGREAVASALKAAGFRLADMAKTAREAAALDPGQRIAHLAFDVEAVRSGELNAVLESLGQAVTAQGGRIVLHGPTELETALLKPLLMGHKTAIPTRFEPWTQPEKQVSVDWYGAREHRDGS